MPRTIRVLVIVSGILIPVHAAGQTGARVPPEGRHAITFGFPEGGGAGFGIRKLLSPRTNAGIEIQLNVSHSDRDEPTGDESMTAWQIGLNPDLRLYRRLDGPVVPFLALDALVRYTDTEANQALTTGAGVGVGVEWFPLSSMSLSGSTGAMLVYSYQDLVSVTSKSVSVGLFHSELSFNLYF